MRFLRNRFVYRTICIFFLVVFVQSLFLPIYSDAFTGSNQVEYTSYEAPGSTDMVNLMTGDFSFGLPILEVPGPEGNFSLPLSYSAGIGLEQEASWTGLGWSLNVGAVTRTINEFPDDANGEYQLVTVQDLTGLRGWNYKSLLLGDIGWTNQNGSYGALSLLGIVNASWSESHTSVGLIGINVGNNAKHIDPVQFVSGVLSIISWGAAGAAASAAGKSVTAAVTKSILIDAASNVAFSGLFSIGQSNTPNAPTAGHWQYSKSEKKNWFIKIASGFVHHPKEYKIWLDQTRAEDMYGTLYLGNAPVEPLSGLGNNSPVQLNNGGSAESMYMFSKTTSGTFGLQNQGAASDIRYQTDGTDEFAVQNNPTLLAPDNFSVRAPGIMGSIAPYRLDVGSVSMPREMTASHKRLAPVRYLPNDGSTNSYKVPFKYNGEIANAYYHHLGGATEVSSTDFYFGIGNTVIDNGSNEAKTLQHDLSDVALKNERIRNDLATKQIPQGNHIEWLSNDEIRNAVTYPSKFMDFLEASNRQDFRAAALQNSILIQTQTLSNELPVPGSFISANNIQVGTPMILTISYYNSAEDQTNGKTALISEIPINATGVTSNSIITDPEGVLSSPFTSFADIEIKIPNSTYKVNGTSLGGFSITRKDGTMYHFALPIYEYDNYTEIREVSDHSKRSIISRNSVFANTWVLTAITGPDFIDWNSNGIPDDRDWGHWVKFNYGNHSNRYQWRIPYDGYRADESGNSESFTRGKSQLIYLNSIETRSHVALFKKSQRLDGRSIKVYESDDFVLPLKLDEIILLGKEHYNELTSTLGMQNYSNQIDYLFMTNSLTPTMQDFIAKNAAKRIQFAYDNTLCGGAPNSSGGKLKLKSISIVGRNNAKIVPDYVFEYDYNPSYGPHSWDGFGMHNGNGIANNHQAMQNDFDARAWSLTKITTPLGGEILINYETDDYSSISGQQARGTHSLFSGIEDNYAEPQRIVVENYVDPNNPLEQGDRVRLNGSATYRCSGSTEDISKTFDGIYTINYVSGKYVYITENFLEVDFANCFEPVFSQFSGTVTEEYKAKKGGGIRVGSLVMQNEFGDQSKVRYLYKKDNGYSSGVIAKEPPFIGPELSFYDIVGYPSTPVLYGTVSVLNGNLSSDNDYYSKQVYEFETPSIDHYVVQKNLVKDELFSSYQLNHGPTYTDRLKVFDNKIVDKTSKIGSLKSVKIFDKAGTLSSSSTLMYTDQMLNNGVDNHQGFYSSGVVMFDLLKDVTLGNGKIHKVNRTSRLEYPNVIQKIISSKDGFSSESTDISWDLLTGEVDQKLNKSSLGVYIKTVTVPAYRIYLEMGSKALNANNKNMLSQIAGSYTYKSDASGGSLGLIKANIQTWHDGWDNYRSFDGSQYSSTQEIISINNSIFRKQATYVWKGDYAHLQNDGTQSFLPEDDFNFSAPSSNPLWLKTGETIQFDHYGMLLESKDKNDISAAVKMGYEEQTIIASAADAKFHEIAFSSAEDLYADKQFFGGEVALSGGVVKYMSKGDVASTHTGDAVVALSAGAGSSFVFKTSNLDDNKRYRASVWTNSVNGRLYYKINGGSEVLSEMPSSSKLVNGWYRIDVELPIQSADFFLEIGVKSTSGEVHFDDFRFQPSMAVMTCYVYPPSNYKFTDNSPEFNYTLDNDNLYTKFEHNERGELTKTYQESITYGVKLISEKKSNYRRFFVGN